MEMEKVMEKEKGIAVSWIVRGMKIINGSSGAGGQEAAAAQSVIVGVPGISLRIVVLLM